MNNLPDSAGINNLPDGGATVPSLDFLSEKYTIDTPENVTFGYEVAGIGSRFIGALVDTLILAMTLFVLNIVLIAAFAAFEPADTTLFSGSDEGLSWFGGLLLAIYALINFAIFWGYYIIFELVWNGQTPGKRVANARVVRADGNPAGIIEIVVRNLVRVVDFLPTGYGIGLVTMFCNAQARRLGDFAAGTMVIKTGSAIDLDSFSQQNTLSRGGISTGMSVARDAAARVSTETADISSVAHVDTSIASTLVSPARESDPLWQRFANVRQLSVSDYELIAETMARHQQRTVDEHTVQRLARAVAHKMAMAAPMRQESYDFLQAVAEAYRRFGG